jgi:hypothetical protein
MFCLYWRCSAVAVRSGVSGILCAAEPSVVCLPRLVYADALHRVPRLYLSESPLSGPCCRLSAPIWIRIFGGVVILEVEDYEHAPDIRKKGDRHQLAIR